MLVRCLAVATFPDSPSGQARLILSLAKLARNRLRVPWLRFPQGKTLPHELDVEHLALNQDVGQQSSVGIEPALVELKCNAAAANKFLDERPRADCRWLAMDRRRGGLPNLNAQQPDGALDNVRWS